MILFYGKQATMTVGGKVYDENVSRAARLEALRQHFYAWKNWADFADNKKATLIGAFNMAINGQTLKNRKVPYLVINAHGSFQTFSGIKGEEVADNLLAAGIKESGTKEVWVAACNVGEQHQDNSPLPTLFIKDLYRRLRDELPDIKVYGPRALLRYAGLVTVPVGGQTTLRYNNVYIGNGNESYDFQNGWVLATLP